MAAASQPHDNPFQDPADSLGSVTPDIIELPPSLSVARNVSLTLGTDSLLVHGGESAGSAASAVCCGLLPDKGGSPSTISYYNILWASINDDGLQIRFTRRTSKRVVRVDSLLFPLDKLDDAIAEQWVATLLKRAYGKAQQRKRIKVLINPHGGTGDAMKRWTKHMAPIFEAAECAIDTEVTQHHGHAIEIAEKLDINAWDVVACCSGDGLPHEVFNGLGKKANAAKALEKVAVVQLPCGSGNAMSLNLNGTDSPSLAALAVVKGIRTPQDLVSVSQGERRTLSFLSQATGIIAESDLGTEHLRWMGGARFTYGILVRLIGKTVWPCDIAVGTEVGDKASIREAFRRATERSSDVEEEQREKYDSPGLPPLRYGTTTDPLPEGWNLVPYDNMGNFYCGNMAYMTADTNFFPAALPSDGYQDMICIDGDLPRWKALKSFLEVEHGGLFGLDYVNYRKVTGYRLIPKPSGRSGPNGEDDGYISIDGERIPYGPFQVESHRGLGTVLSKNGRLYEARGV